MLRKVIFIDIDALKDHFGQYKRVDKDGWVMRAWNVLQDMSRTFLMGVEDINFERKIANFDLEFKSLEVWCMMDYF